MDKADVPCITVDPEQAERNKSDSGKVATDDKYKSAADV